MTYSLYLDDERTPKTNRDFIVVRHYDEAVDFVNEFGLPEYVSFDHDLGPEMVYNPAIGWHPGQGYGKTGYQFAKFLVDYMIDNDIKEMFEYNVHSANPVGAKNIQQYLDNFKEHLCCK